MDAAAKRHDTHMKEEILINDFCPFCVLRGMWIRGERISARSSVSAFASGCLLDFSEAYYRKATCYYHRRFVPSSNAHAKEKQLLVLNHNSIQFTLQKAAPTRPVDK